MSTYTLPYNALGSLYYNVVCKVDKVIESSGKGWLLTAFLLGQIEVILIVTLYI